MAEAGNSNKTIGEALGLSPGTVRNYLSEAAQKLGAGNRIEAGRIARSNERVVVISAAVARSEQLDMRLVRDRRFHPGVTRNQRRIQDFGHGDVDRVITG